MEQPSKWCDVLMIAPHKMVWLHIWKSIKFTLHYFIIILFYLIISMLNAKCGATEWWMENECSFNLTKYVTNRNQVDQKNRNFLNKLLVLIRWLNLTPFGIMVIVLHVNYSIKLVVGRLFGLKLTIVPITMSSLYVRQLQIKIVISGDVWPRLVVLLLFL